MVSIVAVSAVRTGLSVMREILVIEARLRNRRAARFPS
jgi:hypothetical protein